MNEAKTISFDRKFSEAEYERLTEQSERPLEYLDGKIFGMAGGTNFHGYIVGNIVGESRKAARKCGCRVIGEILQVLPPRFGGEEQAYFYPDVLIYCPGERFERVVSVANPVAIIEVLSESTAEIDRGPKFRRCARIPELRHYVLVSQEEMRVEHRLRPEFGAEWETREFDAPEDRLVFPEAGFDLSLAQIYEDIPLG